MSLRLLSVIALSLGLLACGVKRKKSSSRSSGEPPAGPTEGPLPEPTPPSPPSPPGPEPDFALAALDDRPLPREAVTISWSAYAGVDHYELAIGGTEDCASPTYEAKSLKETSLLLPAQTHGRHYVCVFAVTADKRKEVRGTFYAGNFALGQDGPGVIAARRKPRAALRAFSRDGKFVVGDGGTNRVLTWKDPVSKTDQPATGVLGANSLDQVAFPGASARTVEGPVAVFLDGTRLFVVQQSRVSIWNSYPTVDGQPADVFLGQTSPDSVSAGARTASSLSLARSVYSDGTRIAVADSQNNRVLLWNSMPTENGKAADLVLGQPDFGTGTSGTSELKMKGPSFVTWDGAKLFVADNENNRILVWNGWPTNNQEAADYAIGQLNLTTGTANAGGRSGTTLSGPFGIARYGTKLLVADYDNSRVLIWNTVPEGPGVSADVVLGQPNFAVGGHNSPGFVAATGLMFPRDVNVDPTTGKLFVVDGGNARTLVWNSIPTTNQAAADLVLGQSDFDVQEFYSIPASASTFRPVAARIAGGKLAVVDGSTRRVLLWNQVPTTKNVPADVIVGRESMTKDNSTTATSAKEFARAYDVLMVGDKLIACDGDASRVLIWNKIPTADYQPADIVLGQPDMDSVDAHNGGVGADTLGGGPCHLASDGQKLAVSDSASSRVLIWNSIPTTDFASADVVVGQPNETTTTANTGGMSAATMSGPRGVAIQDGKLLVTDYGNGRILIWNTVPTANGAAANIVVGANDFGSTLNCADLDKGLCDPEGPAVIDGGKLYVTDTGNNRVLVYDALPTNNGATPSRVIGQKDFATAVEKSDSVVADTLAYPTGVLRHQGMTVIFDADHGRLLFVPD